jgi:hypothetical protein
LGFIQFTTSAPMAWGRYGCSLVIDSVGFLRVGAWFLE